MAKPGVGPQGAAQHFPTMHGFFLCEASPARQTIFKQLAASPMTAQIASRLPLVRQRMARVRAAAKR
jgi:hypothetical protein